MALSRVKTKTRTNTGQMKGRLASLALLVVVLIEATVYIAVCIRPYYYHQSPQPKDNYVLSPYATNGPPIKRPPVMLTYWNGAGMRKALDFGYGSPSTISSSWSNNQYRKQLVQLDTSADSQPATTFMAADGKQETSEAAAAIAADPFYRSYPPLVSGDPSAAELSPLRELSVVRDRSGMSVRHYPAMNEIPQEGRWPMPSDILGDSSLLKQAPVASSQPVSSNAVASGETKGKAYVSGVKGVRVPTRRYKPQAHNDTSASRKQHSVSATGTKDSNSYANRSNASDGSALKPRASNRKNLVCYYGSWAVYRPEGGKFPVENIDPFLCTHIIYGFTGLSFDNQIKPLDPWNDLEDNYGKGAMKRFTNLKRINPDLKTLIAIGGWNEGSIKFSKMASEPEARARFVKSVVDFLQKYNFDGLDLDWEYPASRGGHSYDRQNFVRLISELKAAFEPKGYLLTAAVSAGKWFIDPAYDIPAVSKYLDLINLMTYDYHGSWETKTGMNAPLFSSRKHDLKMEDTMLNVNWSVNYWLQMGASKDKLMLGVGSYGRSFTLDKAQVNGINAPASQKGQAGPYTREPGSLGYNEICESFRSQPSAWTIVREPDYLAPYAYNDRQWVGYDDQESLTLKAQFAKSMGLGGVMMWSIETDDFQGRCHNEKYPLLNTIKRVLDGTSSPGPMSTPAPPLPVQPSGSRPQPVSTTTSQPVPPPIGSSTARPAPAGRPITARPPPPSPPKPVTVTPTSTTTTTPGREVEEEEEDVGTIAPTKRPNSSGRKPTTPKSIIPSQTSSTTTTTTTQTPPPAPSTTTRRPPVSKPVSSTSTTQKPIATQKPPRSVSPFTCPGDGMFADPNNCRKFIRCVGEGTPFFRLYYFDCGPGTAFNAANSYCDHIYNVPSCNQQQVAMFSIGDPTFLVPSARYTEGNVVLGFNTSGIENQVKFEDTLPPVKRKQYLTHNGKDGPYKASMPRWG